MFRIRSWSSIGCVMALLLALPVGAQEPEQADEEQGGWLSRMKRVVSRDRGPLMAEGNVVLVTVEDLDRPYELVTAFPAIGMAEWGGATRVPPGGGLTDPGLTAITRALERLGEIAKQQGADAVVGVKIDFESPLGGEEGRAIAYGTLVRFIDESSSES